MENTRAQCFCIGRVQGVFFLGKKLKTKAESQGVTGGLKILDDGRVEAVFEGDENAVKMLIEFCKNVTRGPSCKCVLWTGRVFKGEFKTSKIAS